MKNFYNKLFIRNTLPNHRPAHRPGTSLIEIMVFVVVISVAVLGTSSYRYFSMLDIRRSDTEITAGRIATLLCESWKGRRWDGLATYNPATEIGLGFNITTSSSSFCPEMPLGFTARGYYQVVSNNRIYYVTMSFKDINTSLKTLSVIISWPASENAPINNPQTNKLLKLTALVRK